MGRSERGSVLVLVAGGLVLFMVCAALAVDLGSLSHQIRVDQKVADLAALDSVRVLPVDPTTAALQSAARNGFPKNPGDVLAVKWGPTKTGPWAADPATLAAATAVQVSATSVQKNAFSVVAGGQIKTRSAVAAKKDIAGFTLGSSLVNFNSSTSSLLNPIIGQMLGGTVNLSLVSWQGLATGKVTLSALQTQLGAMGFTVGSVSQLLDANLTLGQLYQATATALTAGGDTANANLFNLLKAQALTTATVKLGQLITVEQGAEEAAASAQLNLLQLVTGSATVANGTNLVSVPNVTITVPNVGSLGLSLKIIDGPKTYVGTAGAGPHVTTSQVELTLTPQVNILNLLSLVKVTGAFPVEIHAGAATGTLKSISCPSKNIVVTADPTAFAGALKSSALNVTTLLDIPLLTVNQSNVTPLTIDGPAQDLSFTYSSEFSPPNNVSKHIGSQPLGFQTLNTISGSTTNVNALGLLSLGLSAGGVLSAVLSALDNIVGDLDNLVLTPLFKALGIDIGGADVTALGIDPATGIGLPQCGLPALAS